MTMHSNAIDIEEVVKNYGTKRAVDGVSLAVPRGQLYGFLGRNGAGKSTMLRMMCGLLQPDSGSIKVMGNDMISQPVQAKRSLAIIHDEPVLYKGLTGREFVEFSAHVHGVDRRVAKLRASTLLEETVNLSEAADEVTDGYSRGMRQRAALAGALVHEPEVVLLDEPTTGLDPDGQREIKDILLGLVARGRTVFMATHQLNDADEICDRVAILEQGDLVTTGAPEALKGRVRRSPHNSEHESPDETCYSITLEQVFFRLTGKQANGVEQED